MRAKEDKKMSQAIWKKGQSNGVFTSKKADFQVVEKVGLRLSYGFEKT